MTRRTWVTILVGTGIALVLFVIAAAALGAYFFFSYVGIERTTEGSARSRLETARQQFRGQAPLLTVSADRVTVNEAERDRKGERKIREVRVLTYDPDSDRLVDVTIPFWLVRLKRSPLDGAVHIPFDSDEVDLSVADIERRGPGLIVDFKEPGGADVLVWAQ